MSFNLGDPVRYISEPTQTGTVTRMHPLKVQDSMVVTWSAGPSHYEGQICAYFGASCDQLEVIP